MVLHWRRCGRVGGCQIYGDIAQLGEHLPCKQGVESSNLFISIKFGERFNGKKVLTETKISFIIEWLTKQPEDEK